MKVHALHSQHERWFDRNRFVYPVLSRRSNGISVGVNLNPDKICNFDCIYCQVDRTRESETRFVETEALQRELRQTLELIRSGAIFEHSKFVDTPLSQRRLNDVAFSGDGEPTTYRNFDELMTVCADLKRQMGLGDVKMVLITNASMFHRPHVQRGLQVLDANQGEIWAKLDAGSEAYFKQVERTAIPFKQVLNNIRTAAQERPLVIQSLFMKIDGEPVSDPELDAFCERLVEVVAGGGQLKLVQIYTVARRPAESNVMPLEDRHIDRIVQLVRDRTGLNAEGYYGSTAW